MCPFPLTPSPDLLVSSLCMYYFEIFPMMCSEAGYFNLGKVKYGKYGKSMEGQVLLSGKFS